MKTIAAVIFFLAVVVTASISSAIDPGSAAGTLTVNGDAVSLKYAYAHLHDNAEGWLEMKKEMRILVSDRDVPQETISGLSPFFALSSMVREGSLKGVLIRFDPADTKTVVVTVLYPSKEEGYSPANRTISNSGKSPLENLLIYGNRVSGALRQSSEGNTEMGWPPESYSFSFSAPLFRELPVTAILKDRKALDSPQVKAILAKAAAMKKGDLKGVKEISSERSGREMEKFISQPDGDAAGMMSGAGEEIERSVKKGKLRLIVRGERATLMVDAKDGKSMYGLIRKNGRWLVD